MDNTDNNILETESTEQEFKISTPEKEKELQQMFLSFRATLMLLYEVGSFTPQQYNIIDLYLEDWKIKDKESEKRVDGYMKSGYFPSVKEWIEWSQFRNF